MRRCTRKQLFYISDLLRWHDQRGTLESVIAEIKPDLEEDEDFITWMAKQTSVRTSEVIDILRKNLRLSF
jgi:hypothetical protein